MKNAWMFAIIPGMIVIFIVVLIVALFLIKFAWSWVIPDLFPGAVSQGLIAGNISWYTSFKIALVLAIFSGMLKSKG